MRLSKRQLKRIIREEYSRLSRRGLLRESNYDQVVAAVADFVDPLPWYELMVNDGYKGSEVVDVDEIILQTLGFSPSVITTMMQDKDEFEEYCEGDLGMRLGRCWDIFASTIHSQGERE